MRLLRSMLAVPVLLAGCATPDGDTPEEKRAYTLDVRERALEEFFADNPGVKERAEAAAGTFFLSGFSVHPGMLTIANGYGVVENNATGDKKYVRLARFGVGPGISIKGHYLYVLVHDEAILDALVDGAWFGGAFAEASFEFGFGGSATAAGTFSSDTEGFLWTHTGVALELTLAGAHVGGEDELN